MSNMEKRINYIDVIKGIALLFVIIGHMVEYNSNIFNWIFSFHMPLFFIASGMSIKIDKYDNIIDFIKRKIKTLLLPYLLFTILGFIISIIVGLNNKFTFKNIIIDLVYNAQPELLHMGQLWFLVALFFSSIYYYIIEKYIVNKRTALFKVCTYLIISIIGFNIVKYIYTPNIIKVPLHRLPFKMDSALTALIFIKIGSTIQKYKFIEIINKISNFKYILLLLFLLIINIITGVHLNGYVNICQCVYGSYINYYISSLFGSLFVILLSYKIRNCKIFCYYGKNTLHMFALHSLLLWLFFYIFKNGYIDISLFPKEINMIITSIIIYVILFPISFIYNLIMGVIKQYKIVKVKNLNN